MHGTERAGASGTPGPQGPDDTSQGSVGTAWCTGVGSQGASGSSWPAFAATLATCELAGSFKRAGRRAGDATHQLFCPWHSLPRLPLPYLSVRPPPNPLPSSPLEVPNQPCLGGWVASAASFPFRPHTWHSPGGTASHPQRGQGAASGRKQRTGGRDSGVRPGI